MVDLSSWVAKEKADPVEYRRRQVVEIILHSISSNHILKDHLLLKGGTLMNLAYDSPRATSDVDFTAAGSLDDFEEELKLGLDDEMPKSMVRLGYLDLACKVQGAKWQPPIPNARFPTLEIRVASARKNTNEMRRLNEGQAPNVVKLEISFNEYTETPQPLFLDSDGQFIFTYSLMELIAEKYRAILQQNIRNRYRGQDVYDIARLIRQHDLGEAQKSAIHGILIKKCESRDLSVDRESIDDREIIRRASVDYESLSLQLGGDEISFVDDFALVRDFFVTLPW